MLEFSKKIISKVSFDKTLFRKELSKSVRWVSKKEVIAVGHEANVMVGKTPAHIKTISSRKTYR